MVSISEHLLRLLMPMLATVYAICTMVALCGGWPKVGEEHERPTRIQISFAVATGLNFVSFLLFSVSDMEVQGVRTPWGLFLDWLGTLGLLAIPVQARYLRQKSMHLRNWLLIAIPSLLYLVVGLVFHEKNPLVYNITYLAFYIFLLGTYLVCMWKLHRWDRQLQDEYSDISHKQTVWFRRLTGPIMMAILLWIPASVLPYGEWIWVAYYTSTIFIIIYSTSYILTQEEFCLEVDSDDDNEARATDHCQDELSSQEDEENPFWVAKLETLMNEQRIYHDPNLTSSQLAKMVGINRTYLSRHINRSGETFYSFINKYRLQEAERLLVITNLSIMDIAQECGFTSYAALSRHFKEHYGHAPTNYRRLFSK